LLKQILTHNCCTFYHFLTSRQLLFFRYLYFFLTDTEKYLSQSGESTQNLFNLITILNYFHFLTQENIGFKGTLTRNILAFFIIFNIKLVFFQCTLTVLIFSFAWSLQYLNYKFYSSSSKMLHKLQFFHWTRLKIIQPCSLNTLEHNKCNLWTRLRTLSVFPEQAWEQ
jgi:hypothetical protein